jgi:hypothetical protein
VTALLESLGIAGGGLALLFAVVGAIIAWLRPRRSTTGSPTPEEARVHVEAQREREAIDARTEAAVAAVPGESDAELEQEMNR